MILVRPPFSCDVEIDIGFREALSDAIRERLVADVEVVSYLSGGIF